MQNASPLLNEKEAAEYLGLKPSYLQMRRHRGLPPVFYKLGRLVKYKRLDLDEFLEAGRRETAAKEYVT